MYTNYFEHKPTTLYCILKFTTLCGWKKAKCRPSGRPPHQITGEFRILSYWKLSSISSFSWTAKHYTALESGPLHLPIALESGGQERGHTVYDVNAVYLNRVVMHELQNFHFFISNVHKRTHVRSYSLKSMCFRVDLRGERTQLPVFTEYPYGGIHNKQARAHTLLSINSLHFTLFTNLFQSIIYS